MLVLWAVIRQTLSQCLRSKIASVIVAIMVLMIVFFPSIAKGDGTLSGEIRTLLDYALSGAAILLCVVTVLLAVQIISADIDRKQIVGVLTKPLARWQYIIGRWIGVVLFSFTLLIFAAIAIYGQAQRMRASKATDPDDRRMVEGEIFTARHKVRPDKIEYRDQVAKHIHQMKIKGLLPKAIEAYKVKFDCSSEEAYQALVGQVSKDIVTSMYSARPASADRQGKLSPGGKLQWDFSGLEVSGSSTEESGKILRVDDVGEDWVRFAISAGSEFRGKLQKNNPVTVNETVGQVSRVYEGGFEVIFAKKNTTSIWRDNMHKDANVNLLTEPMVQIHYKLTLIGDESKGVDDQKLHSIWVITGMDNKIPTTYYTERRDPKKLLMTITIPSRVVGSDGKIHLEYINYSNATVSILPGDVSLMIPVGCFEVNFFKAVILTGVLIMFVAAMSVFAASFLNFAVGTALCFSMLVAAAGVGFLAESLDIASQQPAEEGVVQTSGTLAYYLIKFLLPNISDAMASGKLVDGEFIAWADIAKTFLWMVPIRAITLLTLACLIFHKRELSRVQV